MTYEPQNYWDDLLGTKLDESGVAYPWLPISFNRAMYRSLLQATAKLLADHGIPTPERVLDIGAGTGIWVQFWRDAGTRDIVGLDLTDAAVAGLQQHFPDATFVQGDVGSESLPVTGPFDVVSAMSVLLHITDNERWQQAWTNIAHVLEPGGYVVLIEPLVAHQWFGTPFDEAANSKARPLAEYEAACRVAGLELVDVRPATVLLANPIDARSRASYRALSLAWASLNAAVRGSETRGRIAGALLGRLDPPLRRRLRNGPSAKLILARRVLWSPNRWPDGSTPSSTSTP